MKGWGLVGVAVVVGGLGAVAASRQGPAAAAASQGSSPKAGEAIDAVRCDLWSWLDLGAAKRSPQLGQLRQQLLAGVAEMAGTVQALGTLIEQNAESVSVCIASGAGPKPVNLVTMAGRFPTELQARLQASLPALHQQQLGGHTVLTNDKQWLAVEPKSVVWASDRQALLSALHARVEAPLPPSDVATYTSITPRAKFGGVSAMATALGLAAGDWERLTLSTARDGASSEVRIHTTDERAAKGLLQTASAQLAEVRASPVPQHQQVAARLSVEADGISVAFRYAGSLDELAAALQSLRSSGHAAHDPHP